MAALEIGLYIHIPFCQVRCSYCDFNTYAGLGHLAGDYVSALCREIESRSMIHPPPTPLPDREINSTPSPSQGESWGEGEPRASAASPSQGEGRGEGGSRASAPSPPQGEGRGEGEPRASPPSPSQGEGRGEGRSRAATIYFGGGTPSLLEPADLQRILDACRTSFDVTEDGEITVEANPGTVSRDALQQMRRLGINRLSLGIQSFDDAMLRTLDRLHNAEGARSAYHSARSAGFANISLDFMYGLPGQSLGHWRETLEQAIELQPEHLSLYALTLESHVPMARRVADGLLALPDDDSMADMYNLAEDILEQAGYAHYEISNWAKDRSLASRHNSIYWRRQLYAGFGAGAHSFDGRQRFSNVLHPREYIKLISAGESAVAESETITPAMAMSETMFLGLRLLQDGVAESDFAAQHGQSLDVFASQISDLIAVGLLERIDGRIVLSRPGRLLSNQVFVRFV